MISMALSRDRLAVVRVRAAGLDHHCRDSETFPETTFLVLVADQAAVVAVVVAAVVLAFVVASFAAEKETTGARHVGARKASVDVAVARASCPYFVVADVPLWLVAPSATAATALDPSFATLSVAAPTALVGSSGSFVALD